MAVNKPKGDGYRIGAVKRRSQMQTPSGHWVKRDTETGRLWKLKRQTQNHLKVYERKRNEQRKRSD